MKIRLPKEIEGNIDFRIEALARELTGFDAKVVSDACDEWARTSAFWPAVAEILPIARDYQRVADTPQVTGRSASPFPATDCATRLMHRGWPATRFAQVGPHAFEWVMDNHAKGDDFVLRGLEMIAMGKNPKNERRQVKPPKDKPMAKAMELVRNPEAFFCSALMIGWFVDMVARAHGRDEAEYQAGQLAAVATGVAAEALRPWTERAAA